jgi:type VI secretion system secreted protein Hcp
MATDMYLTIEGIKGESQRKGHEKEIEVISWSFGGSNPSSIGVGGGGGAGKVQLQDITITKFVDASSAELFQAMCTGKHFKNGKLTMYKAAGDKAPLKYMVLDFEEMFPTSMVTGGSGGEDVLSEKVTFSFGKVTITYTEQAADGTAKGDHVGSWDVRAVSK